MRDFRYLAPQLSPHLRFIRVDLPGFGASTPERRAIATFPGRVEALVALADHLGLARFAVLGHSMGGGTALLTASRHRERVFGLVLIASIGLRPHRGLGMSPRRFGLLSHGFAVPGLSRLLTRAARQRYRQRRFPGADTMEPSTPISPRSGRPRPGRCRRRSSPGRRTTRWSRAPSRRSWLR